MIRILHISKYYYPYAGGIEDVCYNVVRILQNQIGVQQYVFCFNDKNQTINDAYNDISVRRVAIKRVVSSQPISTCYKKELKDLIVSFKPTHIHFHAPNPLGAYFLMKIIPQEVKLVVHWHSDIVAQKFIYSIIKTSETKLLKRADIIIATSPDYALFSKPLNRFSAKVEVVQNVIDPVKFAMTEKLKKQIAHIKQSYGNRPIILFVGRHVKYKGLKYLIESAGNVKEECIIIIGGNGSLTEKLKKKSDLAKHVIFVGRIVDEELAAYYNAADIFVFPSITRNEAFGIALAEAMYCETPAITFTIEGSGVNWVNLKGVTGIEVENSNSALLAQAIDTLLQNNQLRETMAINAKKRIEELFIVEKIEEKIKNLYR